MDEQHNPPQEGDLSQGWQQQGQTGSGQNVTPPLQQHGPPEHAAILAEDGTLEHENEGDPATAVAATAAVALMQDGVSPEVVFGEITSTSIDSLGEDVSHEDRPTAVNPEQEHINDEVILNELPRHLMAFAIQQEEEGDFLFNGNTMAHQAQQRGEHTIPRDVVSDEEIRVYLETGIRQHEETTEDAYFEPLRRMSNADQTYIWGHTIPGDVVSDEEILAYLETGIRQHEETTEDAYFEPLRRMSYEDQTYIWGFMVALIEQVEEWVEGVLGLLSGPRRSDGSSPDHPTSPPQ